MVQNRFTGFRKWPEIDKLFEDPICDSFFTLQNYSDNSECLKTLAAVRELSWEYRETNWEEYYFWFMQGLERTSIARNSRILQHK